MATQATQIFLTLTMPGSSVRGEASVRGSVGLIEVESFTWGMKSQKPGKTATGKAIPRVGFELLKISKAYDGASITIARCMGRRTPFEHAQIKVNHPVLDDSGAEENPIVVIDMDDGFIEDVRLSMSEGGKAAVVKEDFSLSFRKIEVTYFPASTDRTTRSGAVSFAAVVPAPTR